jgi:hypothetical protein
MSCVHDYSLLVDEAHPVLLTILVRFIHEHHSKSLAVMGATLVVAMRRLLPSGMLVGTGHLGTAGYESAALPTGIDVFVDRADLKTVLVPAIVRIARIRGIAS